MSLTLSDIKTSVDQFLSSGELAIPAVANGIGSAGFDLLISRHWGGILAGTIKPQSGQPSAVVGDRLVYQLLMSTANFQFHPPGETLEVSLSFFAVGDQVQADIIISFPLVSYDLGQSFPEFARPSSLPIANLTMRECVLTLHSATVDDFHFAGKILPLGPLATASFMLGQLMAIQGTISLVEFHGAKLPMVHLEALSPLQPEFGKYKLTVKVRIRAGVISYPHLGILPYYFTQVEVQTVFVAGTLVIPVVMPLYGEGSNMVTLLYDPLSPPLQIANLNSLSGILEGSNPVDFLFPEVTPEGGALELRRLDLIMSLKEKSLVEFGIRLGWRLNWEAIPGMLTVKDVAAEFRISYPTVAAARSIHTTLFGTLQLGSVSLELSMSLPDKIFSAQLAEGSAINLTSVLQAFGNAVQLPGEFSLSVVELEVMGNLTKGRESFGLTVETAGNLAFIPGFSVQGIGLTLMYEQGKVQDLAITASFTFAGAPMYGSAVYAPGSGWDFRCYTTTREGIPIGNLIDDLANLFGPVELPDALTGLEITNLAFSFNTQTRDFKFACETQFPLDDQMAALQLVVDISNTTVGYRKFFSGRFLLGTREVTVSFENTPSTGVLTAAYANAAGERFHLVNDLVGLISSDPDLQLNDEYNLLEFTLYKFQVSFIRNKPSGTRAYRVVGDFGWNPGFSLGGSDDLRLRAQVDLTKPAGGKLQGSVGGSIQTSLPGVEFLRLEGMYTFMPTSSSLKLRLRIGKVVLEAEHSSTSSVYSFALISPHKVTTGDILNFFVGLVNPSAEDFQFEAPWDRFTEIEIPLNDLRITFDTSAKSIGMAYAPTPALNVPGIPASLLSIRSLGLAYGLSNQGGKSRKGIRITMEAKFLGRDQVLGWDPVNAAPPQVPGNGASVFDLRYLGVGQHVAFTQAAQVQSIKETMILLRKAITESTAAVASDGALARRNPLETFGDGGIIAFSPSSEWLIGLDVSLLRTVSLSVIFNDPVIYGLRIELSGSLARNFAGLQFEILYQKIAEGIGKYHIDLTLPDIVRRFQIGAATITLPSLTLDVYTNGDFKVDIGFPRNFNFERSFAMEVFPFVGKGGFYFAKLSAATARSTPVVAVTKGVFTPVFEFGLGLSIGLGKSFSSGPLKAEISISVQGLIEGVIAWWNPVQGSRELFYRFSGGVAIVGRVYGEVDFGIVSASLEVVLRVMVQFVIEAYRPIHLLLSANVSVRASVKIAFIRIRFSFSTTIRQSFTLPSPEGSAQAPWLK